MMLNLLLMTIDVAKICCIVPKITCSLYSVCLDRNNKHMQLLLRPPHGGVYAPLDLLLEFGTKRQGAV